MSTRHTLMVIVAGMRMTITSPAPATIHEIIGGPGGSPFRPRCADNEYLIGARANVGAWVDGLGILFEHGNCSVDLSVDALQDWDRLTKSLRVQGSARADPHLPKITWAEFLAGRREGRRYGPGLQKLCQFDVSRIISLRDRESARP